MDILFNLFGIALFTAVGLFLFTKKCRTFGRNLAFGEVIEDFGIIGNALGGKQTYRLLKCIKDNEIFYVLEVQSSGFGSYKVDMFKLNDETIQNLRAIIG